MNRNHVRCRILCDFECSVVFHDQEPAAETGAARERVCGMGPDEIETWVDCQIEAVLVPLIR